MKDEDVILLEQLAHQVLEQSYSRRSPKLSSTPGNRYRARSSGNDDSYHLNTPSGKMQHENPPPRIPNTPIARIAARILIADADGLKEEAQATLDALREYTQSKDWNTLTQARDSLLSRHGDEFLGKYTPRGGGSDRTIQAIYSMFRPMAFYRMKGLDDISIDDLPDTIYGLKDIIKGT